MKLVVVVRTDLRLSAGKVAAQVGHAVHGVLDRAEELGLADEVAAWVERDRRKKVVLAVEADVDLTRIATQVNQVVDTGYPVAHYVVVDGARTELAVPTATCLGILAQNNCKFTGDLSLYRCPDLRQAHLLLKELAAEAFKPERETTVEDIEILSRAQEYLRGEW